VCTNRSRFDVYQPSGNIDDFFRKVGPFSRQQPIHGVMKSDDFHGLLESTEWNRPVRLWEEEWKVSDGGQMVRIS